MGRAEVVPEGTASSLRLPDAKYDQENAQHIRYIKQLRCALAILTLLCIGIIASLSWHIVSSGDKNFAVEEKTQTKGVIRNVSEAAVRKVEKYILELEDMKKRLSDKETDSESAIMMIKKEVTATKAFMDSVRLALIDLKSHQAEQDKTTMQFDNILVQVKQIDAKVAGLFLLQETQEKEVNASKAAVDNVRLGLEAVESNQAKQDTNTMQLQTSFDGILVQVNQIDDKVAGLFHVKEAQGGVTYVRWGHSSCPQNGTDIVYAGFAGGSVYNDKGAAVNRLCLPKDPEWDLYDHTESSGAKLYGGEYQFDAKRKSKSSALFGKDVLALDAVCSVCLSQRQAVVMIPGRMTCYDGWAKEYSGYLFAGYYDHNAATEYACIDRDPEYQIGRREQKYGNVWYFVEAVCGSLPCPPYINGREITCVVCTK